LEVSRVTGNLRLKLLLLNSPINLPLKRTRLYYEVLETAGTNFDWLLHPDR